MPASNPSRVLAPASERSRPFGPNELFLSSKVPKQKVEVYLSAVEKLLHDNESLLLLVPASYPLPRAQFIAVTSQRLLAGSITMLLIDSVINEVSISHKREFDAWFKRVDRMIVRTGKLKFYLTLRAHDDFLAVEYFLERARIAQRAALPGIFERLASLRELEYPVEVQSKQNLEHADDATAGEGEPKPSDMGTLIKQLAQLGELRDSGILSQEEFDRAKAKLGFGT